MRSSSSLSAMSTNTGALIAWAPMLPSWLTCLLVAVAAGESIQQGRQRARQTPTGGCGSARQYGNTEGSHLRGRRYTLFRSHPAEIHPAYCRPKNDFARPFHLRGYRHQRHIQAQLRSSRVRASRGSPAGSSRPSIGPSLPAFAPVLRLESAILSIPEYPCNGSYPRPGRDTADRFRCRAVEMARRCARCARRSSLTLRNAPIITDQPTTYLTISGSEDLLSEGLGQVY